MIPANSHAIVTGGGSGAGAAIGHALSETGVRVTLLGRTQSSLEGQGLPFEVCDVTDANAVTAALQAARARQGPISIVVASAGAVHSAPISRMSAGDMSAMLEVNLIGVFNVWQAALEDMQKAGNGRLIAIASTAGLKGYRYVSGYCAAKHGVIGLTRALALELASSGITVNAVCPGFTDTPMLERSIQRIAETTGQTKAQATDALQGVNPQHRFIDPAEVASAVLWLCSSSAAATNGHALSLSGGEI